MARIAQVCAVIAVAMLLPDMAARAQSRVETDRLVRPFVSAGKIFMKLSAGAYRVEGSKDTEIRMRWRTRDPEDLSRVRARIDVRGQNATVRLDGPGNHFQATIEVPERTDLTLRLSAGDLDIKRVEGSKDIEMWAGDLTVEVGDANRYRHVSASVRAGEITASPFRVVKGGLFRSFQADGPGRYDLRVKLMAGDVKLVR